MKVCFLTIGLLAIFSGCSPGRLPSYITPCARHRSDYVECLINLIEGLKTKLSRGISEMKLRPLDPFELSFLDFGQESGMISIDYAIFKNISVKGGSNFTVRNISVDFEVPKLTADVVFPWNIVNCMYNISASTFFLPVSGDGLFRGNFSNVSSRLIVYGQYYSKNNKEYVKIVNQELILNIESLSAHLEDSGNPVKNILMNDFWPTLFSIIKPKVEVKVAEIVVSTLKDMLELYEVNELAPK